MASIRRVAALVFFFVIALAAAALASNIADEVFGESGISYEEGHPTASGGVRGWNPLKSLETGFNLRERSPPQRFSQKKTI
jgi:hypothetical protein